MTTAALPFIVIIARASYHAMRAKYYRIAVQHLHPLHPDAVLVNERFRHSRDIVRAFIEGRGG